VSEHIEVNGIATFGGTTSINGPTAIGPGATVNLPAPRAWSPQGRRSERAGADIGVITVLSEESAAVREALNLRPDQSGTPGFDVGTVQVSGRPVTVASVRALAQGPESAMAAYSRLREQFDPAVIVLNGIAGGFHRDIRTGDVVIATRVICYDLRKETPVGTARRGEEHQAPALIGHAVNSFFTEYGESATLSLGSPGKAKGTFRVLNGPIGSGNVVVADRDSEILKYLARFNDKILAIDMESGGLSRAYHEGLVAFTASDHPLGWLIIRGISDDASQEKNDDHHHLAAQNAAFILRELLPYLAVTLSSASSR
jgi:adenosylhomocysteine nucleosidase